MTAPTSYDELRSVLQHRLTGLAPGQQRIAHVLLTDPDGTAFRSIAETARLAEVHQSSVVRFATKLGLSGYPALVALCREQLRVDAQLIARFGRAQQHVDGDSLLTRTLDHERENLQRTYTRLSTEQWEQAVRVLATAEHIHVMGLRKCLPVAQLMAYLLRLVRPGVHQISPVTGSLVDELRELHEGDAFVAASINRYTADTVRAFEHAKSRGLTTITFTDTAASPLARGADVTFTVDCEGVTILRSVTAFISLVQALATAVAVSNGTQSRDELLTDEALLTDFSVYAGSI
ncbi:MAG: MurR/RpiR family transcriptional regulator [Nocardioidaceae bacterium]